MNENEKWGRKRKRKRKTIDDERLRSGWGKQCEVKKNGERGKNAEKEQKEIIRKKKRK